MPADKAFIDTNVLIYLLSANAQKADRAEAIVLDGGIVSVQVLNELVNVAVRKLAMPWQEVNEVLSLIRSVCRVAPLTIETHDKGIDIAERYQLSIHDAMIVASAILAKCNILYSEDMHDGLRIDHQLHIRNPFRPDAFDSPAS